MNWNVFSDGEITLEKIKHKLGLVGLDELNRLFEYMDQEDFSGALEHTHTVLSSGIAVEQFTIDLASYFRSLVFIKHGIRREIYWRHHTAIISTY